MFELEPGHKNVDGQTDVGHTNLIGGLVTCNPPKNAEPIFCILKVEHMTNIKTILICSRTWVIILLYNNRKS